MARRAGRTRVRLSHQQVARVEQLRQVGHVAVRHRRTVGAFGRRAQVHQQPRRVAGLDRLLGDALGGQPVVEVGEVHGGPR